MDPKIIDFINKHINTKVDYDGYFGAQCVDLFRQYVKEMYGITNLEPLGDGGAKDIYLRYEEFPNERKHFMRLDAQKTSYAQPGDIAVWDATDTNQYGHIAIVIEDQVQSILVFEQNGFTQEGAKLKIRSKEHLLGYLAKYDG